MTFNIRMGLGPGFHEISQFLHMRMIFGSDVRFVQIKLHFQINVQFFLYRGRQKFINAHHLILFLFGFLHGVGFCNRNAGGFRFRNLFSASEPKAQPQIYRSIAVGILQIIHMPGISAQRNIVRDIIFETSAIIQRCIFLFQMIPVQPHSSHTRSNIGNQFSVRPKMIHGIQMHDISVCTVSFAAAFFRVEISISELSVMQHDFSCPVFRETVCCSQSGCGFFFNILLIVKNIGSAHGTEADRSCLFPAMDMQGQEPNCNENENMLTCVFHLFSPGQTVKAAETALAELSCFYSWNRCGSDKTSAAAAAAVISCAWRL